DTQLVELSVVPEGEDRITWFIWVLVFAAAIGGLMFGYDTGVISGALVSIGSDLGPEELSAFEKELIRSSTTLGALIGGLVAGVISDYIGRKPSLSHTITAMVASRFLVGIGVGLAACIVPLYIGELLVTVNVVEYAIGAGFEKSPGGWRCMVGLGAVPAGVQLGCLIFLPDSRAYHVPHDGVGSC
ncbi:MFS general substrate transporter, partial [Calocera viscosa TUFC12733]